MSERRYDPESLRISVDQGHSVTVAHVTGEIDLSSADAFREGLAERLDSDEVFVLDLDGVTFMGSMGFSVLVETHHETSRRNIRWAIVAGAGPIRRPLRITGLEQVLPIYPSVPEALAALTTNN
ncbi:STAS domain-containing protein [Actinocrispum wychmicini]|uniref:Anti-sigma factor antagonist n=1 Tax=Actinocrispum wychmicini TaxID=1213861 RepID=A0A4R2JB85_9PSEU|nr:STAS domain-containing protein [Actinocrispum wychmicini]TCO55182.1 anti-anti-sigma factor [Actinocrispum wychmicini]